MKSISVTDENHGLKKSDTIPVLIATYSVPTNKTDLNSKGERSLEWSNHSCTSPFYSSGVARGGLWGLEPPPCRQPQWSGCLQ